MNARVVKGMFVKKLLAIFPTSIQKSSSWNQRGALRRLKWRHAGRGSDLNGYEYKTSRSAAQTDADDV